MTREYCRGTTKAGTPCKARENLSADTRLCITHDPERAEQLRAMRVAGAHAAAAAKRKKKQDALREALNAPLPAGLVARPDTLDELVPIQAHVLTETHMKRMDARTSEASTKAIKELRLLIGDRDVEKRLKEEVKRVAELERKLKLA